jgi:hypothetical protein
MSEDNAGHVVNISQLPISTKQVENHSIMIVRNVSIRQHVSLTEMLLRQDIVLYAKKNHCGLGARHATSVMNT